MINSWIVLLVVFAAVQLCSANLDSQLIATWEGKDKFTDDKYTLTFTRAGILFTSHKGITTTAFVKTAVSSYGTELHITLTTVDNHKRLGIYQIGNNGNSLLIAFGKLDGGIRPDNFDIEMEGGIVFDLSRKNPPASGDSSDTGVLTPFTTSTSGSGDGQSSTGSGETSSSTSNGGSPSSTGTGNGQTTDGGSGSDGGNGNEDTYTTPTANHGDDNGDSQSTAPPNDGGDGTDGGNTDGTDGGNTDGTDGGNTDGGNTDGTDGGNTDGTDGGNTDGTDGGNTDGTDGGNTDGTDGGNTGSTDGGNTDGTDGGNTDGSVVTDAPNGGGQGNPPSNENPTAAPGNQPLDLPEKEGGDDEQPASVIIAGIILSAFVVLLGVLLLAFFVKERMADNLGDDELLVQ